MLDGCCAWFQCRKRDEYDGGDHLIFVGEVLEFSSNDRPGLLFERGEYAVAAPHGEADRGSS